MVLWKSELIDVLKFYLADFCLGVILLGIGIKVSTLTPYDSFFLERDPTLSYPLVQQEVSIALLAITVILF